MPLFLAFHDRVVAVEAPPSIAVDLAAFFRLCRAAPTATPYATAIIAEDATAGRYRVEFPPLPPTANLTRGEVIARLATCIREHLWFDGPGVALRAGAVSWGEKAALILSREGEGRSSLIAWLIENGFAYLADSVVLVTDDANRIVGFPEPPALRRSRITHVGELPTLRAAPSVRGDSRVLVQPDPSWRVGDTAGECGLILDARFEASAGLAIEPLSGDDLAFRLLEQTQRVVIPGDPGHRPVARLAAAAPAFRLTYGSFAPLDGVLDFLMRLVLEGSCPLDEVQGFVRGLAQLSHAGAKASAPKSFPVPPRSDRKLSPRLTIGMATYDDFDGVYFTIQSMRLYHPEVLADVEFVVVDNHPDGPCSNALKDLERSIANYRYIPMQDAVGTAQSRNRVFEEASGEYVLCVDCHVMIAPGALKRLLDYFAANPDTRDLLQGPLLYDDLRTVSGRFDMKWSRGFHGVLLKVLDGIDPDAPPFEIEAHGLGLFACRRAAWPGFHPGFRGFGAEEGYIHAKFRRLGGQVLNLPFLRWLHPFPRPMGVPYPNNWIDRVHNYLLSFREQELPIEEMQQHFRDVVGAEHADELFEIVGRDLDNAARR